MGNTTVKYRSSPEEISSTPGRNRPFILALIYVGVSSRGWSQDWSALAWKRDILPWKADGSKCSLLKSVDTAVCFCTAGIKSSRSSGQLFPVIQQHWRHSPARPMPTTARSCKAKTQQAHNSSALRSLNRADKDVELMLNQHWSTN